MKLLHWCTLSPQGPSSLAAIRFSAPIRVSLIRIFPNGSQPFTNCPDVIAQTEPDSFYLDVFFNAQALKPAESKEKQRAPNALVPTTIAYAGGQADFTVDLGTEYATRLMIVKGKFDVVSFAIYGEVVSDAQPSAESVQDIPPTSIPSAQAIPLSRSLDVANAVDPTQLAKSLLSIIPESPSLSLASRLVLCMKPESNDWDDPDFPHLYANLEREIALDSFTLEDAVDCLGRPIAEDTTEETMLKFWKAVAHEIESENTSRQSALIAKLFKLSASQHPSFALDLCLQVDPVAVFNSNNLECDTLHDLLDAAANADIAHHFNSAPFLEVLQNIQRDSSQEKKTQTAAHRLASRLQSWDIFQDALTNTQADFAAAIAMLKDIGSEEQSVGIWLASMILHDDLVTKLSENPVFSNSQSYPRLFMRNASSAISHDDFIAFVRGYIGVISVFAVWAWSDSLGNDPCRERVLGVLRLWQGVDGYHELVNYFLLLRQFSVRLKWITSDNDVPRKSGFFGEQMLADLVKDPQAVLRVEVTQAILALEVPLSFIPESELLSLRKLAYVSEDGLPAAIEEIFYSSDRPLSLRRLRTLRVSLAIVSKELAEDDRGEWRILQIVRDEHGKPFIPRLTGLLHDVSANLNEHFVVTCCPPNAIDPAIVDLLLRTADDLLHLISQLSLHFSLTTHLLRSLTLSVADIFACTDAADTIFYQTSAACISAQVARQTCLDVMRQLSRPGFTVEPDNKLGAEVILRTLLYHSVGSAGRDPVYHLQQIFSLIDHILPERGFDEEQREHWVISVLPTIQMETLEFFRLLDLEHKVPFMHRLIGLDEEGMVGLAEWLFIEELKQLSTSLRALAKSNDHTASNLVIKHGIQLHLQFIQQLLRPKSEALQAWSINTICTAEEASPTFTTCLVEVLHARIISSHLENLIPSLLSHASQFDFSLKSAILLVTLRVSQRDIDLVPWLDIVTLLESLPVIPLEGGVEMVRREIGRTFSALSRPGIPLTPDSSKAVISIMKWLSEQQNKKYVCLCGIKAEEVAALHEKLSDNISSEEVEKVANLRSNFSVDEDEMLSGPDVVLTDSLELSMQNLEGLLTFQVVGGETPSTPSQKSNVPDVLGIVFSPPTAILRSPAATGLTKTYQNNDFRDLRQTPSARQNTSRLPSTHVDVGINGQST
ncbi:hypothetical protein Moror_13833 [Moniliophthora roreri MCA 2997]|uniref:Virilizer N-terminal domain-containing protein n=1 Tax=Moniliophthora roreri (strain MCA 2997) TaxID=1381753 RepID=V2XQF5_MONRO|nr:hypothetical protein Moror_13833 [Moniliophthora roreri MCA 2997]